MNGEKYQIWHLLVQQIGILVLYSFYVKLVKNYEINHQRSITTFL